MIHHSRSLVPDVHAVYIHFPYCVKRCPYCDFNAHQQRDDSQHTYYVNALIQDIIHARDFYGPLHINSVFFGGGTPSLMQDAMIEDIISAMAKYHHLPSHTQITLEANPGTIDHRYLQGYQKAGVNRISLGIQSFNDDALKALGRIHNANQSQIAIDKACQAGFNQLNIDIMYALPGQDIKSAMNDLELALSFKPGHISWYQLTIEPNTLFYHKRPLLPNEDEQADIADEGMKLLAASGYDRYEISAYSKPNEQCDYNVHVWRGLPYIGLGAGSHGRYQDDQGQWYHTIKHRHPLDYIAQPESFASLKRIDEKARLSDWMILRLRLTERIDFESIRRAHLPLALIIEKLKKLDRQYHDLLIFDEDGFSLTPRGLDHLGMIQEPFI